MCDAFDLPVSQSGNRGNALRNNCIFALYSQD